MNITLGVFLVVASLLYGFNERRKRKKEKEIKKYIIFFLTVCYLVVSIYAKLK